MSYDQGSAIVYIGQLVAERHPAYYDLCRTHVDTLSTPRGWTLRREPLRLAGVGGVGGVGSDFATEWARDIEASREVI